MLQCDCEDLGLDIHVPLPPVRGMPSEAALAETILKNSQCSGSSVFSKHLLKGGGEEESLCFCRKREGKEEEDPLEV